MAMAESSSLHSIREELECPICLDTLRDPRTLVCQHSFCTPCLQGMVRSRDRITCPECRHDTLLPPDRDVSRLPKPILLSKLCERVQRCLEEGEGIEIHCDLCKKLDVAATSVCRDCCKNMCSVCVRNHGDTSLFSAHMVIPLSENTVCKSHRGEMVKFYCTDCNKGVCVICATGEHSRHKLQDIESLGLERRDELDTWCHTFTDAADQYEHEVTDLMTQEENLGVKFAHVQRQVERWYDEAMALLQQNKLTSLANLQHRHQSEREKWRIYLAKLAENHNSQRGLYDLVRSVIKSGSGAEIVACARDLSDVIPSCEVTKQPALAVPAFNPPDVEEILSKCLVVYEIQKPLDDSSSNPRGQCIPIFPLQRNVISTDVHHAGSGATFIPAAPHTTDLQAGNMYKTVEVELGGYVRDVAWDQETNWFFVKCPAKTKVYSPLGDELRTIEHNGWEGRGLAIDTTRNLLITTESAFHKIKQWTKEGEPAGDVAFSGFWHGLFKLSPEYLTYCPLNDVYVTTDHAKAKAVIVSPEMRSITTRIEGAASRLVRPRYVTCDCKRNFPEGLVAISDKGDHTVKVYSADGELREVYGGLGEGELASPSGLCYDTRGRLLVCDTRNKRVVRFSSPRSGTGGSGAETPGGWECVLGPEELEQQYPKALDLTGDNKLVVVTYDRNTRGNKCNHKLNVYGGYV